MKLRGLVLVLILSILLTGCASKVKEEQVAYNVSMRDVVVTGISDYRDGYKNEKYHPMLECVVNGENRKYELDSVELYNSVSRLIKTYAITNPGQQVIIDLIYDTDTGRVIAVALKPQE